MTQMVKSPNMRWISHRLTAHRMRDGGQSLDAIADHLRVSKRSVHRYLTLPCPELPEPEVELSEFVLEGACGAFPEVDFLSRSSLVQTEAKAICEYCPVLAKCRSYGLNKGRDDRGVLGAMTKAERQREITRRQRRTSPRQPRRGDVVAQQQGVA